MVRPVNPGGVQPNWLKAVRLGLSLAALGFLVWAGQGLVRDWRAAGSVTIAWWWAWLSLPPALASSAALAIAWAVGLRALVDPKPPVRPLIALYGQSNLGRYVPGKVAMPLLRITGAARWGVAARITGTSVALELLSWIATACVVVFVGLALADRADLAQLLGPASSGLALAIALAAAAAALIDRRWLPPAARVRIGLEGAGPLLPRSMLVWHGVMWLTWALHGQLVALAVGASPAQALAATPFFVLGPVAGFLALLAPAGVGVREALIAVGLSSAVGPKAAVAAALITRVASLIADLAAWLGTRHWDR